MIQFRVLLKVCFSSCCSYGLEKHGQPLTEGAKVFYRCIDLNANDDQKEYSNNPCNSTRSSQQGSQQPPWCCQQQNCPSYHNLHSTIARSPPIKIEFKKNATGRPSNSSRLEEKRRSKRTKAFMRSPGKQYVEMETKQERTNTIHRLSGSKRCIRKKTGRRKEPT